MRSLSVLQFENPKGILHICQNPVRINSSEERTHCLEKECCLKALGVGCGDKDSNLADKLAAVSFPQVCTAYAIPARSFQTPSGREMVIRWDRFREEKLDLLRNI